MKISFLYLQEFLVGHEDTPVDSSPLPPLVNIDR